MGTALTLLLAAIACLGTGAGLVITAVRRRRALLRAAIPSGEYRAGASLDQTRRREALRARVLGLGRTLTQRRGLAIPADAMHAAAAGVEAYLLAGGFERAVALADAAVRASAADPAAHVLSGRARFYANDLAGASTALARARALGASGPTCDYLDARIRLGSGRYSVSDLCDTLSRLLDAALTDSSSGEAAYHAALVASTLGMREEARAVLAHLRPLMQGSPERVAFERDCVRLRVPPARTPAPVEAGTNA